jgi:hypothetical protein
LFCNGFEINGSSGDAMKMMTNSNTTRGETKQGTSDLSRPERSFGWTEYALSVQKNTFDDS